MLLPWTTTSKRFRSPDNVSLKTGAGVGPPRSKVKRVTRSAVKPIMARTGPPTLAIVPNRPGTAAGSLTIGMAAAGFTINNEKHAATASARLFISYLLVVRVSRSTTLSLGRAAHLTCGVAIGSGPSGIHLVDAITAPKVSRLGTRIQSPPAIHGHRRQDARRALGRTADHRRPEIRLALTRAWLSQELGSHKRRVGNYLVRSGFVN